MQVVRRAREVRLDDVWNVAIDEDRRALRVIHAGRVVVCVVLPPDGPDRLNRLVQVENPQADEVATDVRIYVALLEPGAEVVHWLAAGCGACAYVVDGAVSCEREDLAAGDAGGVTNRLELTVRAWQLSTFLLVDVPIQADHGPRPVIRQMPRLQRGAQDESAMRPPAGVDGTHIIAEEPTAC